MSGITEHLGSHQPSHTSTNHDNPLGIQGPIEAQGHDLEQLLIVRVMHALLKGVLNVGILPVQGSHQAEDRDKDEEAPGWEEEGRVSGQVSRDVGGERWVLPPNSVPVPPLPPRLLTQQGHDSWWETASALEVKQGPVTRCPLAACLSGLMGPIPA